MGKCAVGFGRLATLSGPYLWLPQRGPPLHLACQAPCPVLDIMINVHPPPFVPSGSHHTTPPFCPGREKPRTLSLVQPGASWQTSPRSRRNTDSSLRKMNEKYNVRPKAQRPRTGSTHTGLGHWDADVSPQRDPLPSGCEVLFNTTFSY